jgi:surfactin synthase thioesterase subunit
MAAVIGEPGRTSIRQYLSQDMHKLICFPFAGAGASFFRPWAEALAGSMVVTAVQLPGRENRFAEHPYASVEQAINDLEPELGALVEGASALTIFGHCMGAVLAYELALRLKRAVVTVPCRLIVSGSPSPTRPRAGRASGLSDNEFASQVRELAGYSHPSLEDPEMRELLLPVLRADVGMHEAYSANGKTLLDIPVISVRGRDDELVSQQDATAWQEVTCVPLQAVEMEGNHMYLADHPDQLMRLFLRVATAA